MATAAIQRTQSFGDRGPRLRVLDGGLSPAERDELAFFFCRYEEEIGQRSTHGAMLAAWGGTSGGEPHDAHERMAELVDSRAISRAGRIRAALRMLHHHDVVVLWRLFGPRNLATARPELGDASPLADLTDACERAREELALRSGEAREERVAAALETSGAAIRADAEREFWRCAGRLLRLDERAAHHRAVLARPAATDATRARSGAALGDIEHRRVLVTLELRAWLAGATYDGLPAARCTACASADRELSAQDALRIRLATSSLPKGPQRDAQVERRRLFIVDVKRDAATLRLRASRAYQAAKESLR